MGMEVIRIADELDFNDPKWEAELQDDQETGALEGAASGSHLSSCGSFDTRLFLALCSVCFFSLVSLARCSPELCQPSMLFCSTLTILLSSGPLPLSLHTGRGLLSLMHKLQLFSSCFFVMIVQG